PDKRNINCILPVIKPKAIRQCGVLPVDGKALNVNRGRYEVLACFPDGKLEKSFWRAYPNQCTVRHHAINFIGWQPVFVVNYFYSVIADIKNSQTIVRTNKNVIVISENIQTIVRGQIIFCGNGADYCVIRNSQNTVAGGTCPNIAQRIFSQGS